MTQTNTPASLTALVLDLGTRKLLVPNTAIAELASLRNLRAVEYAPDWFLGSVEWRGLNLPVLSFATLAGDTAPVTENSRMVVVNALSSPDKLRFYALCIQSVPRSIKVDASLVADDSQQLSPYELSAVSVYGELMYIPKLEAVEQLLLNSLASN